MAIKKISSGFTLIEIMIVLAVLSIVVGMFAANLTPSPYRLLTREAQRLQAVLNQASDEAVMQGIELALALPDDGYQVLVFNPEDLNWQEHSDKPFERYQLPDSIQLDLDIMDGSFSAQRRTQIQRLQKRSRSKAVPTVLLLSSGEITPFNFTFSMVGFNENVSLFSDGFSGIEIR